jgi:hypothetical protein
MQIKLLQEKVPFVSLKAHPYVLPNLPRPSARTLSVLVTGQYYNLYFSLSYIAIDGAVNVNVELSGEKLNLSILTVVASARNFREMRSDDRLRTDSDKLPLRQPMPAIGECLSYPDRAGMRA